MVVVSKREDTSPSTSSSPSTYGTIGTTRPEVEKVERVTTYVAEYIKALLTEYGQRKYRIDMREVMTEGGPAGVIAKNLVTSGRSLVPTMQDMTRRIERTREK